MSKLSLNEAYENRIYADRARAAAALAAMIAGRRDSKYTVEVKSGVLPPGFPDIIAADPRLLPAVDHIHMTNVSGSGQNVRVTMDVTYTDILPGTVEIADSPGAFRKAALLAARRHNRTFAAVFPAQIEQDIKMETDAALNSSDFINTGLRSCQHGFSKIEGSGWRAAVWNMSYRFSYRQWRSRSRLGTAEAERIAAMIRSSGQEDWRRAYELVRWCVENWTYGRDEAAPGEEYTFYGALLNHKAVCMGFSLALCRIFDILGIPCRYVTGRRKGGSGGHAWNMIFLRGGWFYLDLTDAIAMKDPLYRWGFTELDDRVLDIPCSERLQCNCSADFIRSRLGGRNAA